jgi:ribonuclease Z
MSARMTIDIVNGIGGDPAVVIGFQNHGNSLLLDAGSLESLAVKDLLKIRTVCISHAHVDHFIGFDRIIRVNVPHFRTLEVVGPAGIANQIRSKLLAYTWNLLEANQLHYRVHEVLADGKVMTYSLSSDDQFTLAKPEITSTLSVHSEKGVVLPLLASDVVVSAVILDHGTPVCGYSVTLPDSFSVSIDAVEKLGLTPGPWIGELQKMAVADQIQGTLELPTREKRNAQELADAILTRYRGQKITYLTDIVFSHENLARVTAQFSGSDTLICETNFRHLHRDRAAKKKHLTTKQAALFAVSLGCKTLKIFHISNIYANDHQTSVDEAEEFFSIFASLGPAELQTEIESEYC